MFFQAQDDGKFWRFGSINIIHLKLYNYFAPYMLCSSNYNNKDCKFLYIFAASKQIIRDSMSNNNNKNWRTVIIVPVILMSLKFKIYVF